MQQVTPANDGTVNTQAASVPFHCVRVCVCSRACVRESAGCGRTGVICALDYIYNLLVAKVTYHNMSHDLRGSAH